VEHKVIPQSRSPQDRFRPSNIGNLPNLPSSSPHTSLVSSHNAPWCSFHKTNSHSFAYYHSLNNLCTNKTLFIEMAPPESPTPSAIVSLNNPTEVDPSLILMSYNEPRTYTLPLFTHNFHIKHELATLIMDNGSQKNLVSQDLVQRVQLTTTPHPASYQLCWVQ
jgi:hypothetical protein